MRLAGIIRDVLDFCYPGRCAACQSSCAGDSPLCDPCGAELDALASSPACGRCGKPSAGAGGPCPHCHGKGIPPYDRIVRLATFGDPLKQLVHEMKYRGRWPIAEQLADRLFESEAARARLWECDCVLPVPLHPLRQVARGYNQAEVIAARIARRRRLPVVRPVVRVRPTETQTHIHSHAARVENLRGAFALVDAKPVAARRVLVVDDVMTSGATLQSLARCLAPARPASLCAAVLAVADPRGQDFQVL